MMCPNLASPVVSTVADHIYLAFAYDTLRTPLLC